jgi:hypothetical protein
VTEWEYDPHYGADADGHRGMPMTFHADADPEDVTINHDDCPSTPLDEESRERQAEILAAIEAWQETHPAEAPEDDGDDCGYDDVGD